MSKNNVIAVFPGTFDPMTLGHLDVIERATHLADKLYVAIAASTHKSRTMFNTEERLELAKGAIREKCSKEAQSRIEVVSFDSLLVEYASTINARFIIRSLRNIADFDYEFQLAGMNSCMSKEAETIFLLTNEKYQFVSSTYVREIAKLDGELSPFVTDNVVAALRDRCKELRAKEEI